MHKSYIDISYHSLLFYPYIDFLLVFSDLSTYYFLIFSEYDIHAHYLLSSIEL
jgi:hypothetical protein